MLMGDLLEEFFKRPYVAAKVAEGRLPDTWRAIVGDRAADLTTERPATTLSPIEGVTNEMTGGANSLTSTRISSSVLASLVSTRRVT